MRTVVQSMTSPCPLRRRRLGDLEQIMGDHPPTDPAFHARLALIAAALQPMPPFEPTNAAFDTRTPVVPTPKPAIGADAFIEFSAAGRLVSSGKSSSNRLPSDSLPLGAT